jgi:thiol-disulfide isomerase/thioredoxin
VKIASPVLRKIVFFVAFLLLSSLNVGAEGWSLRDKEGVRYTLSGLHGKWVLVNFWAPWCASCLQEIPDLISLQNQYKDLQVIGVAVMYRTRQEVMDVVTRHDFSYPVVFGSEDTAGDFGGMSGMPTSFLYSPAGKLVARYEGPLNISELKSKMIRQ